jgi:hypothetical protein
MKIGNIFRKFWSTCDVTTLYRIKSFDDTTCVVSKIDIKISLDYFNIEIESDLRIPISDIQDKYVIEIDQEEFERLLLEAEIFLKMNRLALISKPLPPDYTEALNETIKKQMSDSQQDYELSNQNEKYSIP